VRNSIRTRLMAAFVALTFIPLLLLGGLVAFYSLTVERDEALARRREVVRRAAAQLAFIGAFEDPLRMVSQVQGLSNLDRQAQHNILSQLLRSENAYHELALVDEAGREQMHLSQTVPGTSGGNGERFQADEFEIRIITDETYYSPVLFDEITGEPHMTIAVPLVDAQSGLARGALVADKHLKGVWDLVAGLPLGDDSCVYIMDQQGRIVAHENPSRVVWGTHVDVPGHGGLHTGLSGAKALVASKKYTVGGRTHLIVVETPLSQALDAVAKSAGVRAILAFGALAAAGFAGVLVANTITGPVRHLVQGAEEIGRGNLEYRIEARAGDEIGQLADAFNDMAASLDRSLGETAHSQRLLLAHSQAGHRVQRARSPGEVYHTILEAVAGLGYNAMVFTFTSEGQHLTISHLGFDRTILTAAEKVVGRSLHNIRLPLVPGSFYHGIIAEGKTTLCEHFTERLAEALPEPVRLQADRVASILGIEQGIVARLTVSEETYGLLVVTGSGLTEADVPAVTTFANQAAIAIENALLYEEVRNNAEVLEHRVAERTKELESARQAALRMMKEAEQAEEALRVQAEELTLSNAELEQFAYVASHDLQEPLRAISGYLQLLERRYRGELDESAGTYIDRSVAATARMKTMITDLLTFSRVGTHGKPFVPVDSAVALEQAMDNLHTATEESGALITHNSLPTVLADASQLVQLFQNLLGNAIKFRGAERPQICVSAQFVPAQAAGAGQVGGGAHEGAAHWRFSVQDNGIGIELEYAERIFIIFQRLHSREDYPGTGIGLAVCQKIVSRHGGRIWVESEPGAGSTFYFTLPDKGENEP
jgi:signal transduction histidine kinase/HAMP domain-containing protein